MTYINAEFGEIGITDLEYRFFDAYNDPIDDWVSEDVIEEMDEGFGTGIYGTFADIPDNAVTIRWRRKADHFVRAFGDIANPRRILNPTGLQKITEDQFALSWDTRNFLNGPAKLEVFALGSDGLWAKDEIELIISNLLNNTVYYKEFFCTIQQANLLINKVKFSIDSYALSSKVQRRGWLEVKVRTAGTDLVDDATLEQCETWWDQEEFSGVNLVKGASWRVGPNNALIASSNSVDAIITQIHSDTGLEEPSNKVAFGIKITPSELLTGFPLEAEGVKKIREYTKGKYFVFTHKPAKIFEYDGTDLTLLMDLSDIDLPDAIDATYVGGIIYAASQSGKLTQIYTDESNKNFELVPTGEIKPVRFVENNGTLTVALYDDGNVTTAYDMYALKKIWENNISYDFITLAKGKLIAVKNNFLYVSEDSGVSEPELEPFSDDVDGFPANIVAVSEEFVALANGDIYYKDGDYQILYDTNHTDITSVTSARVGAEGLRVFAGLSTNKLIETNLDLSWSDSRVLDSDGVDGNSINRTNALWHYEDELEAAKGTPGSFDYAPAVYDDRLLIGTNGPIDSEQGMLLVLEKSGLNEKGGAILVSQISYPVILAEEVILGSSVEDTSETPTPQTGPVVNAS